MGISSDITKGRVPAAVQVVELIGVEPQRAVGGEVKADDSGDRSSVQKRRRRAIEEAGRVAATLNSQRRSS